MARRPDQRLDATEAGPPGRLGRIVLRGVGLSALGYVATQALTLGFFLVLARIASPSDFGEYAAGSVLVAVGLLLAESGMVYALVHRKDRLDEAAATAAISTIAGGVLFSLLALAAAPLIGTFFDSAKIGEIAAVSSGLLLLRSIPLAPTALLQRKFSFVRRTIVEPIGVIGFGVAAVIACSNGMGAWGLVIGYYAQATVDVILSWTLARWRPRLRLASRAMWRELVDYGKHVFAGTAVIRASNAFPPLLIGRALGAAPLGQYRYAARIANIPLAILLAAGSYVLFPAFARIADDRDRLRAAFLRALRWVAAIGVPAGLVFIPLGVPIAVLVFGPEWEQAGEAAMALAGLPVCTAISNLASESFAASGRPQLLTRMHVLEALVAVAAASALLGFDLVGVCAGLSLGALAGAVYGLVKVHTSLGVETRLMLAELRPAVTSALLMVAIMTPLELLVVEAADRATGPGLALLAAELLLATLIYAGAIHLQAPGRIGEFRDLLRGAMTRRGSDPPEREPDEEMFQGEAGPLS